MKFFSKDGVVELQSIFVAQVLISAEQSEKQARLIQTFRRDLSHMPKGLNTW